MPETEILTVTQAARFLKLSPHSVYVLLRRRKLPGNKIGGTWRLSRSHLVEMVGSSDADPIPHTDAENLAPSRSPDPGSLTPNRSR